MSAFGKRNGVGGGRPSFGVAKPMKGSGGGKGSSPVSEPEGGDQFPPLEDLTPSAETSGSEGNSPSMGAAMDRLTARQNSSGEPGLGSRGRGTVQ